MASVAETLLTAEEYGAMPDDGRTTELVRGRIVELAPPPSFDHGYVCLEAASLLRAWVKPRGLGRVVCNDSGVITGRGPDTVRGADVAYYSFDRLPQAIKPRPYPGVAPEIVVEVRSPSDRQGDIEEKIAEYIAARVLAVCVLAPDPQTATVHRPDREPVTLGPDDELTFPGILDGFSARVASFFE